MQLKWPSELVDDLRYPHWPDRRERRRCEECKHGGGALIPRASDVDETEIETAAKEEALRRA